MHNHDEIYPQATRELVQQRKRLAPGPAEAFRAFSQSVFEAGAIPAKTKQLIAVAAEMRAGGAYAHSALALDTIARSQAEKARERQTRTRGRSSSSPVWSIRMEEHDGAAIVG